MHWNIIYRNFDYFLIGAFPKDKLPGLALLTVSLLCVLLLIRWWLRLRHLPLTVVPPQDRRPVLRRRAANLATPLAVALLLLVILPLFYDRPLYQVARETLLSMDRLGGMLMSVILASLGIFGAFWLGLVVGLLRLSKQRLIRLPALAYIEIIRGVPLVMLIFWFFFLAPTLLGQSVPKFWSTLVAFIVFTSAYIAEIVRAGVQSLPKGQTEAARGSGLSRVQSLTHVILPQALRNMIPSFVNQFVSLTKDTSLASIIGVNELFLSANQVNQRELRAPMEIFLTIALMYFVLCYVLTATSRRMEKHLSKYQARGR